MKRSIRRNIVIFLILIICINFVFPQISYCSEGSNVTVEATPGNDPLVGNFFGGILDGVIGILLYPAKLSILIPGMLLNLVISGASIYGLFFNEVELTNIDIFSVGTGGTAKVVNDSIAQFYIALRLIAIMLSLASLIYIGIRMAISNIAEEKAKYKQMLVNWLIGFALLFIMHYIMIITITANEMLIDALKGASNQSFGGMMTTLLAQAWWIPFTTSFGSAIMYIGMAIISIIFLIVYVKRKITICLLITISPLISVSYAIDKVGNNKAEILNTWLKEFLYNVLIQPFHCIIYVVFIEAGMRFATDHSNFGTMLFAIILTLSVFSMQKIVREIFGFSQSSSLSEKFAVVAFASSAASNVKSIASANKEKNKYKAEQKNKQLKKLGVDLPGGEETSGENISKLSDEFDQTENERSGKKGNIVKRAANKVGNKIEGAIEAKRPKVGNVNRRRVLRKRATDGRTRRALKGVLRWEGKNFRRFSYYDAINAARKNRRKNKTNKKVAKLTDANVIKAFAQSYRKAVDPNMDRRRLAGEFERISETTDLNTLTPQEIKFKLAMEAAKTKFGLDDDEIRRIIENG
ncbi:MAG: hypothetical protein IKP28_02305 [Clostridia bacterium]|nr:hypothetical protein [Clostridia bacterium]